MGKLRNPFWNQEKSYKQLASANSKAIEIYNERILSMLLLIGGALMILPLLAVPFSTTKYKAVPAYLLSIFSYLTMFILFKIPVIKKFKLLGLYAGFSMFFIFSIYLSLVHSPNMRATILLGVFCIMPLSFIDRPLRINLFVVFWFLCHTFLAFRFKTQFALDDTINSLGFAILGCYMGNIMVGIRLQNYDVQRQLIIEKETDVLTGLYSRRKLFEVLEELATGNSKKPTGIMLFDIDKFKEFNDRHGHAAGDVRLQNFGLLLQQFSQTAKVQFYRYGGEEFLAMAFDYGRQELLDIAENLRIAVKNSETDDLSLTISIGVVYCGGEDIHAYEKVIEQADKTMYKAKKAGRDKVCIVTVCK